MSSNDFILDNLVYSFSSASTYETCNFAFYLTYIMSKKRFDNFYNNYGNFVHKIHQLYFEDKLDFFEMSQYYKDNYDQNIIKEPPMFHRNAKQDYYQKGLEYFDSFSFDKTLYDVLIIEDPINVKLANFELVVKPDLVLHHKETGKNILVDFKTSNVYKNGKLDKSKMEGYMKQFLLYCWGLYAGKQIEISEIQVWFVNCGTVETFPVDVLQVQDNLQWFIDTVEKIKKEEDWVANNKNKFFCNELCSVSSDCPFRP